MPQKFALENNKISHPNDQHLEVENPLKTICSKKLLSQQSSHERTLEFLLSQHIFFLRNLFNSF